MATVDSKIWRVLSTDLRWRFWDDQTIVYHPGTGDIHLLNRITSETVHILKETPLDVEHLSRELGARLNLSVDDAFLRQMSLLLDELDELGLVEPVSS